MSAGLGNGVVGGRLDPLRFAGSSPVPDVGRCSFLDVGRPGGCRPDGCRPDEVVFVES